MRQRSLKLQKHTRTILITIKNIQKNSCNKMKRFLPCITLVFLFACKSKQPADLLILDGNIYTVDSVFSIVEAMAVKDGKIIATGTSAQMREQYEAKDTINAKGQFIYPGFIDAHAHFFSYGQSLRRVDLVGTNSW